MDKELPPQTIAHDGLERNRIRRRCGGTFDSAFDL